ncbi:MAG: hypothetical protein JST42_21450 [Bacteroidetes bacterium]|nr:hypothetical protein [Bacteroidota bacterium]
MNISANIAIFNRLPDHERKSESSVGELYWWLKGVVRDSSSDTEAWKALFLFSINYMRDTELAFETAINYYAATGQRLAAILEASVQVAFRGGVDEATEKRLTGGVGGDHEEAALYSLS